MKFQKAWKIYFWFLLVLFAGGWLLDVLGTDETQASGGLVANAVGGVVEVVSLVGLYAFISQVALGKRSFWIVFAFVSAGSHIWAMIVSVSDPAIPAPAALFVFMLALLAPLFAALFLYAFRSQEWWTNWPYVDNPNA